jgi:hypothetical protein
MRALAICLCVVFLFVGCDVQLSKSDLPAVSIKPAATQPAASIATETGIEPITKETQPRWFSQSDWLYTFEEVDQIKDGARFFFNRVRVADAKDAVAQKWINGEIAAFEKEVTEDTTAKEDFLQTLKLTGQNTENAVENRSLITQPCLSGCFFSLLYNENISNTQNYENTCHTRTWDINEKKQAALKDLFITGADYESIINSFIRRQLIETQSEEDILKRPFDGIDSENCLFALGPGMGQGARYGMTHLEFIFPDGNPYFAYYYVISIPLYELREILKPKIFTQSPLAAVKGAAKSGGVNDNLPAKIMPDTHICETQYNETQEDNTTRREVFIDCMADQRVMVLINDKLRKEYGKHSNEAIKKMLKAHPSQDKKLNADTGKIRFQASAQEFGGFLAINWEVFLYSMDAQERMDGFDNLRQSGYLLYDLETGKKLTLSDIASTKLYKTNYYKANKGKISTDEFRLDYDGTIEFQPKDFKTELPYDETSEASQYFDWDQWKSIRATSLQ